MKFKTIEEEIPFFFDGRFTDFLIIFSLVIRIFFDIMKDNEVKDKNKRRI